MDLAKISVLNEEMRRKSYDTSSHSYILAFEYRGEETIVLQKTKIKVGATLEASTKMLSVTIVIRKGT